MIKNKCKKIISLTMLIAIISTMLSVNVYADNLRYHGNCGENVRYSFNEENGELVIFGEGDINNYNVEKESKCLPPW